MIDRFTYKETEYANALLENGFMTKYENYEMSLLCKLWKETGLPKKEARQNLLLFCELYSDDYDEMIYYSKINRVINRVYNKDLKLAQVDYIPIYKHEFDFINSLDYPHPYKRLLFAFLVIKKIHSVVWSINSGENKLSGLVSGDKKQFKMISEMAHLKGGKKESIEYMIYDLSQDGLINTLALAQIYLNFIDTLKEDTSEEIIRVSDFEHVWMYFDFLSEYNRAGRVAICQECNKPMIVKDKAPQKYCQECKRQKELMWKREYAKRKRIEDNRKAFNLEYTCVFK